MEKRRHFAVVGFLEKCRQTKIKDIMVTSAMHRQPMGQVRKSKTRERRVAIEYCLHWWLDMRQPANLPTATGKNIYQTKQITEAVTGPES